MSLDSFTTIIAGVLAAAAVIISASVARLGEPRRLRLLVLLNQVINDYGTAGKGEVGKAKLKQAREDLARRTAKHLVSEPPHLRFLTWVTGVTGLVAGSTFAAFLIGEAFGSTMQGQLFMWAFVFGALSVVLGAIQWLVRRAWINYVPPEN